MKCYLIRHGKDDDSVRGGWSRTSLTAEGVAQAERLAAKLSSADYESIRMIYTSDLVRARQTADILSAVLRIPVCEMPAFREVNNGELAGMSNTVATESYPGLYWNTLEWDQPYPCGESPHEFFNRIHDAWHSFKEEIQKLDYDVIHVTHGGVIQVIQCIESNIPFSNKEKLPSIGYAEILTVDISS